ncbi:phosphorylated adapter RNA export protein-like [Stegodyphus dumicola]|uniref:phosphorylated adapter RNA export protein-like n=1 Tax=Stegodyphus dumicola TaxID=202533 RepID=UPI0015AFE7D4|nr:phosphorylated adapter RNA export protein-like [Stegodyphus dumicola]
MDAVVGYRVKQSSSSDSDSEDSDKECTFWKRASRKPNKDVVEKASTDISPSVESCIETTSLENVANPVGHSTSQQQKRKRNTIWSDVLEDQLIAEDLGGVLLKNKPKGYGSRGHESYDYTLGYQYHKTKGDLDNRISANEYSGESETNSRTSSDFKKIYMRNLPKLDGTETSAAWKIVNVLNEKKKYLIFRVVKILGIEKAMKLLKMTEEIEDNGGMMIKNNTRRRTPGGVYFQLIKNDKSIDKEVLNKIFEGEMSSFEAKKFYDQNRKKKQSSWKKKKKKPKTTKGDKNTKQLEESGEMMLDEQMDMDSKDMEEESLLEQNAVGNSIETDKLSSAILDNHAVNPTKEDLEDGEILD